MINPSILDRLLLDQRIITAPYADQHITSFAMVSESIVRAANACRSTIADMRMHESSLYSTICEPFGWKWPGIEQSIDKGLAYVAAATW